MKYIVDWDTGKIGAFYTLTESKNGPMLQIFLNEEDRHELATILIEVNQGHPRLTVWFNTDDDPDLDLYLDDEKYTSRGCTACGQDWDDHPHNTCSCSR